MNNKQSPVYNKEVHRNLEQFLSIPQIFTPLPFGATEDKSLFLNTVLELTWELYIASNAAKKILLLAMQVGWDFPALENSFQPF